MEDHTKPRDIIFVTLHLTDGGAERVASELIKEWVHRGCKVIIVQIYPDMFSNSYPMPKGVEYVNFDLGTNRCLKIVRGITSLVKIMKKHPDATVVSFSKVSIYFTGIASLFTRNRVVLSERNDPYSTPESKMRRKLRDWAFKRADACVFQTPDARDYFPQTVRNKGTVIPNPINNSLPHRYEGKREKIIVAAGRLVEQKNFSLLIKAFAAIHSEFHEYKLIIYGRGPLEDELKKIAQSLDVEKYVFFPGFSDNIYQDMLKCAVYVSSSDYEGMSNSMLEALAMGIPSVVTDCPIGGARMVIENNVNGVLVPVGDEKAMSEGIRKVLTDPAFADSIGKEAYKLRDYLPVEKIADQWIDVL